MAMHYEILKTDDGYDTLINTIHNVPYHSRRGSVLESMVVYIQNGLEHYYQTLPHTSPIRIFEMGFGTGLNALLTLDHAESRSIPTHYTSIDLYPLPYDTAIQLNYADNNNKNVFHHLHKADWGIDVTITPHFTLHKIKTDLQLLSLRDDSIDVIYFDAFAPSSQPELWNELIADKLYNMLSIGGILTTYCAQGAFKRHLKNVGFKVERLPGPPGKREMTRAIKISK